MSSLHRPMTSTYEPLSIQTLPRRLGDVGSLADRLGPSVDWQVAEVGDGNLNLVFVITSPQGSLVAKQALPYVRAVGESWPLSLDRSFFEYNALLRLNSRDPGRLPELIHHDRNQAVQVMEHLSPHVILRKELITGKMFPQLATHLGNYLARTLFRGSELGLPTVQRKADLALFAGNVDLTGITENLVFTDPFCDCPRNHHTGLLLEEALAARGDVHLKRASLELKTRFCTVGQTLLHGDLHTGSVMVSEADTRIIDAEFATYGPMGFDIGSLVGNLWMAYFAHGARCKDGAGDPAYGRWILDVAEALWHRFVAEFTRLWHSERNGILGGRELFEQQADSASPERILQDWLSQIWEDTLGYAGIEMHRRILGFAHIAEIEALEPPELRASCERRVLRAGRSLALERRDIRSIADVTKILNQIQEHS